MAEGNAISPASQQDLNNLRRTISSGSLHDIVTSGFYYVTGGVTDKPTGNGGMYIVTAFNAALLVGLFCNTDGYMFMIVRNNGAWTTYSVYP